MDEIVNKAFRDVGLPEDDPIAQLTRSFVKAAGAAVAKVRAQTPRNAPPTETVTVLRPARGTDAYDHEHRIPRFRSR